MLYYTNSKGFLRNYYNATNKRLLLHRPLCFRVRQINYAHFETYSQSRAANGRPGRASLIFLTPIGHILQ